MEKMEQFWFSSDGFRLFGRKTGQGSPVIMIHGACVDSDFFRDTAAVLSASFTVYLYDRRGYGRSEDGDDHSIAAQAEDAAALIREIGTPCHIIAHSAGTAFAMELAARHPELVRKMLLHEPVETDCMDPDSETILKHREISELIRSGKTSKALGMFIPLLGEKDPRGREPEKEEQSHAAQNSICFIRKDFQHVFSYHADPEALHCRDITVGTGEHDGKIGGHTIAKNLSRKLGCELVWFPGGHNGPYDLPREFAWIASGTLMSLRKENQ